jgi:hypothetical protein
LPREYFFGKGDFSVEEEPGIEPGILALFKNDQKLNKK